jgi:hypothetical protein
MSREQWSTIGLAYGRFQCFESQSCDPPSARREGDGWWSRFIAAFHRQ